VLNLLTYYFHGVKYISVFLSHNTVAPVYVPVKCCCVSCWLKVFRACVCVLFPMVCVFQGPPGEAGEPGLQGVAGIKVGQFFP